MKFRLVLPLLLLTLLLAGCAAPKPAPRPVVLFDQSHDQMFLVEKEGPLQLSGLARLFSEAGCAVETGSGPLSDQTLAGVDILVSSGPFAPFTPAEVDAVGRFLERGGRLALLLHIAPPAAPLLERLGLHHSNGVLREQETILHDQPLDFRVTRLESHPLFSGVEWFGVFGAWAIDADGGPARLIARTSVHAWVDLDRNSRLDPTDAAGAFGVAAAGELGAGRFVVFGDDAIFQNRYLEEHNGALGRNLVRWLKGEL